jgi:hypothetical protein
MPNQETQIKLQAEISASANGLVSALNQATSAINNTTGDWKTKFAQLKDSTNLISQSVKNLGDTMKSAGEIDPSNMQAYNSTLGEVSATFERVKGEVDAFAQSLSAMKNAASSLGMPIEEYQAFADAVKASGVDMQEAQNMLSAMQSSILDFANGVPQAESMFSKLGVTLEQVSSNTVGANFQLLVNALNDTIPASERATQNMQLFKSSIDSTLKVAQQYQKTVSEQAGTYATDKEVQNAISLSSAIEKLGKQLNGYANTMQIAADGNSKFNKTMTEMTDEYDVHTHLLEAIIEVYGKYADNLESTSKKALETTNALKILTKESREANKVVLTDVAIEGEDVERNIDDFPFLENLIQAVAETKDSVQKEIASIQEIMSKRIASGAPVDTTELDEAMQHFASLKQVINELIDINQFVGFTTEQRNVLDDMSKLLVNADEKMRDLATDASKLNRDFDLKKINNDVVLFRSELERAWRVIKKGGKIRLDTKEIDETIAKLQKVQQQSGGADYSTQLSILDNLKRDMDSVNLLADRSVSKWGRIKNAIKDGWNYLTHFRSGLGGANGSAENLGTTFAKGVGQMVGMGSAVATVTLAMRKLVDLAKEYVKQLLEAKKAMSYGNLAQGAESMTEVRTKSDSRYQKLIEQAKEYADLVHEERETGSRETRAKRINLGEQLLKQYGLDLKQAPNRGDIDKEIADKLNEFTQKRMKAIDSQLKANERMENGVDEFIDGMGYWKRLGYTFTGDVNGANAIKEAQEQSNKAKKQDMELMEERRRLSREDLSAQFLRIRTGKEADKAEKERKDADEKATTALEEATKKLDEWQNSITDTDRQKNLREIMAKYEDAVREGVDLEEARNVAVLAIAKMLQKEREDEDKKNKELLKAVEDRIKAYKDAYKAYVEADKAVVDAKKDYAQKQKELADEAKSERIAKRRERLQKAMGRFGFSPYEGFKFDESSSERRERRRNAQIDASIADKMAKSQSGKRVTWTHSEKERLAQFNALQRKDKQLEASQKAMEAADKQKKAAEALQEAARAIREAMFGRGDAGKNLRDAGKDLREASRQRRTRSRNLSADKLFEGAKKGLTAKGIGGALQQRSQNYNGQLTQLHKDLQGMAKRVYVVK